MYKACLCCFVVGLLAAPAAAQITVPDPPAGANVVSSANDFATQQMQDPWDMNQRSDFGWWLNGVDAPPIQPAWTSTTFANGLFSGTVSASGDPNIWLLETENPFLPPYTKTGGRFPINADFYRIFSMRMCAPQGAAHFNFFWVTNSLYDGPETFAPSNAVTVTPGCRFYFVDLATLGGQTPPWSGIKRALRFDPAADNVPAGSVITIDWVRLVDNRPDLLRAVTWTGGGNANIYLDNDTNAGNGNLGVVAPNVASGHLLNVGALEPGDYYVYVQRISDNAAAYSPGFYRVNAAPVITITSPSEEGSADDFATIQLNDAWDMTAATDVDHTINVTNGGINTIPTVENEAGTPLGNLSAYYGVNTNPAYGGPCASFSKPAVYLLHPAVRGAQKHIDPTRYRIVTAELGLPNKPRDLCNGSIVRFVWQVSSESAETYSWGVALNSRGGANTMARLNFDIASIPIDTQIATTSKLGWVPGSGSFPGISSFRIDPHEFADPTGFFIKRVKLAAFDKAHTSFNITWTLTKNATVSAYYGATKDPNAMTLIGTIASGTSGSMSWDTTNLPQGALYYVYLVANDGVNANATFSKWPVLIDHVNTGTARIIVNRTLLNYGVTAGTIKTPAQLVRLSFQGAPAGQPCWTATSDLPHVLVSPASGCGGTTLTVQLANQSYAPGNTAGAIRITSAGAINSPQFVQAAVRVSPSPTTPPTGVFDTPADGTTVNGSVAVTGWATDDIGIARITICRAPIAGEPGNHPACGAGQVYIGDAVFVDDARPDVAAIAANRPFQYRAGWGLLILTNMLPNQGNGAFTLYAHAWDLEGFFFTLGSKVINANNGVSTLPFGNIDTPLQGETVSGLVPNYGWVLSRTHRADPPGGGAVSVWVDGVQVGIPGGWTSRPDLTAAFPGYPGINTALAVYGLDTSVLSNGIHSIIWIVNDNTGAGAGVGSRYFNVFNTGSSITEVALRPSGPDLGRRVASLQAKTGAGPVLLRIGFNLNAPARTVAPSIGGARHVRASERDRVEIRLNGSTRSSTDGEYAGYLVNGDELRELPIGSSFDPDRGIFYWQPGLAFSGAYDFLFVRTGRDGTREQIPVRVTLEPQQPTRYASVWNVRF